MHSLKYLIRRQYCMHLDCHSESGVVAELTTGDGSYFFLPMWKLAPKLKAVTCAQSSCSAWPWLILTSAVTGIDAFLAELRVDRAKQMQTNGELDTQVRPAELEPFFVRYSEHGIFGVRYNKTDAGFAQNRNASGLPRLPEKRNRLTTLNSAKFAPLLSLYISTSLGQDNVLVDRLTGQVSRSYAPFDPGSRWPWHERSSPRKPCSF